MKRLNKFSLLLTAAFLFAPLAMAQTTSGIGYDKTVKDNGDKTYEITMTAFTTGQVITTIDTIVNPCDIVLILDYSRSMTSNSIATINSRTAVTSNNLSYNTNYLVVINGIEYYLRGFRGEGTNTGSRYYYRIRQDQVPTAYNDGADFLTMAGANGTSIYEGATLRNGNYYTGNTIDRRNYPSYNFYTYTTSSRTRLEIMKEAAQAFVNTIYSKNPSKTDQTKMHNLSVLKFGTEVTYVPTTLEGLNPLTETNKNAINNRIEQDNTTLLGTYSEQVLEEAYNILYAARNDGRPKVTVFFTDGEPSDNGSTFNNYRGLGAVEWADKIKGDALSVTVDGETVASKVFSVAILTSETSSNHTTGTGTNNGGQVNLDIRRFLHYVSSNYKTGLTTSNTSYRFGPELPSGLNSTNYDTNWTGSTGGSEEHHGYYQLSNGADLTSIFQGIAEQASNASTTSALSETSVVAVDVVSHSFKLPDGADESDIQVLVAPFERIAADNENNPETGEPYTAEEKQRLVHYRFGEAVPFETALAYTGQGDDPKPIVPLYKPQIDEHGDTVKVDGEIQYTDEMIVPTAVIDSTNRQKISVSGFNYGGNPVGFEVVNGQQTTNPVGYELVIKIPIVVKVESPGGASVQTNDEGSGIYIDGSDKPLVEFPRPTVTLPNIIVRKYGLDRVNESASFKLEKMNDAGTAVDTSVKPYYFIITHDGNRRGFDFAQVKLQEPGTYRVTETDWAWNYTTTVSKDNLTGPTISPTSAGNVSQSFMIRTIGKETEQTDDATGLKGAIFDFKNTQNTSPKISVSNYNEANKVNIFPTKSVAPAVE